MARKFRRRPVRKQGSLIWVPNLVNNSLMSADIVRVDKLIEGSDWSQDDQNRTTGKLLTIRGYIAIAMDFAANADGANLMYIGIIQKDTAPDSPISITAYVRRILWTGGFNSKCEATDNGQDRKHTFEVNVRQHAKLSNQQDVVLVSILRAVSGFQTHMLRTLIDRSG